MAATVLAPAGHGLPELHWIPSPNYSARGGSGKPNLIVIHDTQGSYQGSVNWFAMWRSHVSAHLALNENGTMATQMVRFSQKAWHACWFNSSSIGIEMAGFEEKGFAEAEWTSAANITAYLCHRFGIPVRWAQGGKGSGIAQHRDLGKLGGGHVDATPDPNKWLWFMGLVAKATAAGDWPAEPWGRL